MNELSLTCIITCHNYENYIAKAISSVLIQKTDNIQLIVVDAGSTDRSKEIILSFKNLTYISVDAGSHVLACQRGLNFASQDYILFLDADDFLMDNAFSRVAQIMKPTYAKVQFNLRVCNAHGHFSDRLQVQYPNSYSPALIKESFYKNGTYIWPPTSGNIFSKRFINKVVPLNSGLPFDGQLNTLAPLFGDIFTLNEPLAYYRLHSSNKNNRGYNPWSPQRFQINVKKRYREFFWARKRAHSVGMDFPKKNILNWEINEITYRVFLRKLGYKYFFYHQDSYLSLTVCLFYSLFSFNHSLIYRLKHLLWHFLVLCSPSFFVSFLVCKRFSRGL